MYLVDLPGYGYATANEEIKAKWGVMIENYLHTSKQLKAVFLLIDIRHEPSENDQLMYEWMVNQGYAPIIIATKADKLKPGQIHAHVEQIKDVLSVEPDTVVMPFSAESKLGKEEIWELIDSLVLSREELTEMLLEQERKKAEKRKKAQKAPEILESGKKDRWKASGHPVAKKTQKKAKEKKLAGKKGKKR